MWVGLCKQRKTASSTQDAHGGKKTPTVFAREFLFFEAVAAKATTEFTNPVSGDGASLGAGDCSPHLPYFLLVGWEEELLVGARHL